MRRTVAQLREAARALPPGPCGVRAATHGTSWAYETYRCRCPDAVRQRYTRKMRYQQSPKGMAKRAAARARNYQPPRDGAPTALQIDRQLRREDVVRLTRAGCSAEQIAMELRCTPRTVLRDRAHARRNGDLK